MDPFAVPDIPPGHSPHPEAALSGSKRVSHPCLPMGSVCIGTFSILAFLTHKGRTECAFLADSVNLVLALSFSVTISVLSLGLPSNNYPYGWV